MRYFFIQHFKHYFSLTYEIISLTDMKSAIFPIFKCLVQWDSSHVSTLYRSTSPARGKEPVCQCWRHKTQVQPLAWEDPLKDLHGDPLQYCCLEESGRLQSVESQSVGHDWSDLAHTTISFEFIQFWLVFSQYRKQGSESENLVHSLSWQTLLTIVGRRGLWGIHQADAIFHLFWG